MAAQLEGKVAVVTGASKGMGRMFVSHLIDHGAQVAVLARQSTALDEAGGAYGKKAAAFVCDVADPDSVRTAFDRVAARFGRIDILINNAARTTLTRFETATDAQIAGELGVNLAGPIYCTRAVIPYLRKAGGGDVIFISSESVRMPYPFLGLYAATKGGVETLAAAMRTELREDQIRVTVLRSGGVEGSSLGVDWPEETKAQFFETIQRTGHAAFTGEHASQESIAQALLSVLTLPRDVNVDIIEVRAL
ncbi:MAG: SDR family oxidoreductase [Sphingobium sp.]